ncbi:MAG: phosphatidylserine decarboxylase [Acetatifactor muris]|nr:phosphatidylserine decarboxylase [Acetatifactor muris]MCM1525704.1 phosphatidylserine decarboxylase [Bacteroides sp.]
MWVWDRKQKKKFAEAEDGGRLLAFLYGNPVGRILLKYVAAAPWYSRWRARYYKSRVSARRIPDFVRRHRIDMAPYRDMAFKNFNDFFTRRRPEGPSVEPGALQAVAESRCRVYDVTEDLRIHVKQGDYSLQELFRVGNGKLENFRGGICIVYRLSLADYHRYLYPDRGREGRRHIIRGMLHTVRPVSREERVFAVNCREWSLLRTQRFGRVLQMEVGAMLVGHIVNRPWTGRFDALEEKGYFEYGGSCVIQVFEPGRVVIDRDIREQSAKGMETRVLLGERIGCVAKRREDNV